MQNGNCGGSGNIHRQVLCEVYTHALFWHVCVTLDVVNDTHYALYTLDCFVIPPRKDGHDEHRLDNKKHAPLQHKQPWIQQHHHTEKHHQHPANEKRKLSVCVPVCSQFSIPPNGNTKYKEIVYHVP
jgi:hypothetical protein